MVWEGPGWHWMLALQGERQCVNWKGWQGEVRADATPTLTLKVSRAQSYRLHMSITDGKQIQTPFGSHLSNFVFLKARNSTAPLPGVLRLAGVSQSCLQGVTCVLRCCAHSAGSKTCSCVELKADFSVKIKTHVELQGLLWVCMRIKVDTSFGFIIR